MKDKMHEVIRDYIEGIGRDEKATEKEKILFRYIEYLEAEIKAQLLLDEVINDASSVKKHNTGEEV